MDLDLPWIDLMLFLQADFFATAVLAKASERDERNEMKLM